MTGLADDDARARATSAGLDEWAVDNLLAYLREQREATRHVPSDRTILVERFRDELGDWRLVVHSPFGAQVNGPWALAIAARMRERRGVEVHASGADDGIVLRLPDTVDDTGAEVVPTAEDVLLDPAEVEQIVVAELGGSSLYASRFRECAARALLLPRRDPKRRSPLWQQRQKSAQLLAVAGKYEQFPVTLEAMRECVQDVYDLPGLRGLMGDIAARKVRVTEVVTASPSPFARSLLFGYVGMFLYETDAPLAERRAAALALDSTLLAELLGSEAIRELLDPEVVTEVEQSLQRLAPDRHARDAEGAADLLRFLGPLSTAEAGARGVAPEWLTELEATRRVIRVRVAGEERWTAIEDAGRVRDALGAPLPVGVPETFTEPVPDPLGDLLLRHARTHGPFRAAEAAARFGLGVAVVSGRAGPAGRDRPAGPRRAAARRRCATGHGDGTEYCDAEVLRRLRRASLARLRSEVEPVEHRALGRFLPAWQGVQVTPGGRRGRMRRAPGVDDVMGVVEQLAGAPLPASALESLILPARLPGYTPALLDELTAAGEVTWTGCGALAGVDGWLALAPTDVADLLLPEPDPDLARHAAAPGVARRARAAGSRPGPASPTARRPAAAHRVRRRRRRGPLGYAGGGALFFRELADRAGRVLIELGEPAPGDDAVVAAIWDLVWAGLLTNDTLAPLRARLGGGRGGGGAHRTRRAGAARPLRPAAGRAAGDAQPVGPGVGGRPVGRRAGPRARRDPPGARPRRGVPGAARGADPRCAGHRAGRGRVRRRCTGCCGRWRTPGGAGAATSSRGSVPRSSRCRGRSTGCGRCRGRTAGRRVRLSGTPGRRLRTGGRSRRWLRPARIPHRALPGRARRRGPGPALRRGAALAGHRRRDRAPAGPQGGGARRAGRRGGGALRRAGRALAAVVHRRARGAAGRGRGPGRGGARGLARHAGRRAGGRGRLARLRAGRGAHRSRVPGHAEGPAAAGVSAGSAGSERTAQGK